jgi:hypothetical protein
MRRFLLSFIPIFAGAIELAAAPRRASAQVHADLDLDVAFAISPTGLGVGGGAEGRVGYRFDRGPVWLQPEITIGFQHFDGGAAVGGTLGRLLGGGRVGLTGRVQPNVFAHFGGAVGDGQGFALDAGAALDVQLARVNLGAHVSYNLLVETGAPVSWLDVGPHVGFTF